MSSRVLLSCLTLSSLVALPASARVPYASAPKPNAIQAKYLTFENEAGGLACKPQGTLQSLLREPYKCYLDLDECGASLDAVSGKLDASYVDLFADLLVLVPGEKVEFAYACPGDDDPRFLEGMAITGLGYAKATQHLDKLLALATPEALKSFTGAANRGLLVKALVAMGPAYKEQTAPALVNLVKAEARTPGFKRVALQALGRFENDGAVDYCLSQLKGGTDKDTMLGCVRYLGEREAPGALDVLVRNFEGNKDEVARALGQLGDKGAIPTLEAWVNDQSPRMTIPGLVALINLGKQKEYMPALTSLVKGQIPLSKKDEEKKAAELAKAKDAKAKAKVTARYAERTSKVDASVAQSACMEATLVADPAAEAPLTAALKASAASKDTKEWKVRVYGLLALAQRGDKAAIAEVAKLLADPAEQVRTAALQGVGGLYSSPGATFSNRGRGVVSDASMVPALLKYIDNEPKKDLRASALHAVSSVRSFE